jgi:hypothetical protein
MLVRVGLNQSMVRHEVENVFVGTVGSFNFAILGLAETLDVYRLGVIRGWLRIEKNP